MRPLSTLSGRCAAKEPDIQPRSTRSFRLLNHLVRVRQHRLGDREAQCLRGFQVDHQLELSRLLDGQVVGLGAFENLVHVGRGAPSTQSPRASRLQRWIIELYGRQGYYKTLIAIANKHARILWAMLARDEHCDASAWQHHPTNPPPIIGNA
jgi:hypothetical protein